MSPKPRLVFDTSVLVSALLFEQSPPGKAVYTALSECELLFSSPTFGELSEVLCRTKLDRYLAPAEREQFLVMLLDQASLVETAAEIRACRDPKDDKFLDLLVGGQAACLVTGDQDLLVLNPFRGIPILSPADFLLWFQHKATEP